MISWAAGAIVAAVGGAITLIVALSARREWNAEGSDDQRRATLAQEPTDDGTDEEQ